MVVWTQAFLHPPVFELARMKKKLLMNELQCTERAPGWTGIALLASGRNAEERCREQSAHASELNLARKFRSEAVPG